MRWNIGTKRGSNYYSISRTILQPKHKLFVKSPHCRYIDTIRAMKVSTNFRVFLAICRKSDLPVSIRNNSRRLRIHAPLAHVVTPSVSFKSSLCIFVKLTNITADHQASSILPLYRVHILPLIPQKIT